MNLKAKPIVDGKFWIVEEDGEKVAILHKKENNKHKHLKRKFTNTNTKKENLQTQKLKEIKKFKIKYNSSTKGEINQGYFVE